MPTPQKTYTEEFKREAVTEEFKREAVRLAQERGNVAQTARDLGVSDSSILYWQKQ